ncbi:MAG: hypothetical protein ICV72_07780 [Aldersonia sp.]|nr:hypothetical protein [Aldersonia sp.]
MRNKAALMAALAAALLLPACGESETPSPTGTPTDTATTTSVAVTSAPDAATTTATPTATPDAAPIPTDSAEQTAEPAGNVALTVRDLRIGRHTGYDRVVYEFGGSGVPGYRVGYVDQAVEDGSGDVIDIGGASILAVSISGTAYPFDSGVEPYAGTNPLTEPSAAVVQEVYLGAVYEGITQSYVGTRSTKPAFRVSTLSNPTRLVVDIAG